MAAAEARTAWQRTANRCFLQEDAKRAPKLACCPSSSAPQNDSTNGNRTSEQDHLAPNFMPLNWNPMNPNLSPDTKWWLQLQPNLGYQFCEQFSSLEDVFDDVVEGSCPTSKLVAKPLQFDSAEFDLKKNPCFLESPWMMSTAFMKHGSEDKVEIKSATSYSQEPLKCKLDNCDFLYQDEELLDWKPIDQLISKVPEKARLDTETCWAVGNKSESWWRITDKDELALLVAQKSLQHIENCDLPRPRQTVLVNADPFSSTENLEAYRIFQSPLHEKLHTGTCNPSDGLQRSSTSGILDGKTPSSGGSFVLKSSDKMYSGSQASQSDPSRAELLEALRHSQTRARKAEMAAQKAYDEKEHIIKLLFRQASQLFAYKLWLHMLQLESLCLQLKIKNHQISTLIPVPPWMPLKGKLPSKQKSNKARRKGCNICKYAFVFAVGLGLAGAGFLFGWTLGWLLPVL